MQSQPPTISIRLPSEVRARLDLATAKTQRSRSFLMQRALEKHLDEIEREEAQPVPRRRLTTLLSLAGAGVDTKSPRSVEEIDAHLRWLRDNG